MASHGQSLQNKGEEHHFIEKKQEIGGAGWKASWKFIGEKQVESGDGYLLAELWQFLTG